MVRHSQQRSVYTFTAMAKFVVDFASTGQPAEPDGRLHGPAFQRNHAAIWSALAPFLLQQKGDVLEIGSGTGQHIAEFARRAPDLTWWPSDIYPSHLASIEAWRRHAGLANLRAPQRIDLTDPAWTWTADGQAGGALVGHALHQRAAHLRPGAWRRTSSPAPAACCAPMAGCSSTVRSCATAQHTAPSNAAFDASLRAENPDMGRARRGRPECPRARSRLDGSRDRAHAGQQSGPGVRARRPAELKRRQETGCQ